jgi:glycosyltransferase involved in cell wall biosynthesis
VHPDSETRPLVLSLCGTFLKPEMQSIYRQVTGLRRWRTIVLTEQIANPDQFPFDNVFTLRKRGFRPRGNFLRRFFWKHIRGIWPPPGYVEPLPPRDFEFCDLLPLLKRHQPALLHIYYGHKARKYLPLVEKWGGPLLVSFHGVDVAANEDKKTYQASFADLFAYATIVAARSQSLLDRLAEMGCPPEKLRLNRTPIPLSHIKTFVRTPPTDGKWNLVQACRLIRKKGLFTTIEALKRVVEAFPEMTFTIAGEGTLRDELADAIVAAGLSQNISLAGWMDQASLMRLFEKSHLFLHPSETTGTGDQEGIPNSMLEAMASGLPVVATQHGGIPEAMDSGIDGLLVPERTPDELADALIRILSDSAFFEQCSKNAARTASQRFGLEIQIENLEACYDAAVAQPPK